MLANSGKFFHFMQCRVGMWFWPSSLYFLGDEKLSEKVEIRCAENSKKIDLAGVNGLNDLCEQKQMDATKTEELTPYITVQRLRDKATKNLKVTAFKHPI